MSRQMTTAEIHAFLDEGTRTAKLAWVGSDGRPHAVPIWFVRDGDDLVFNTGSGSAKGSALRRDPRASVVVDEEVAPYSFVKVDGIAEISDDVEAMRPWSTRIGGRYMGPDRAEEFGRRNAVEGELLIRLRPTKITAVADVAGD